MTKWHNVLGTKRIIYLLEVSYLQLHFSLEPSQPGSSVPAIPLYSWLQKNGNNKIETFLQFFRSVKPPYENCGQSSMTFLKFI
jgi:hypothetical protein